MSVKKIRTFTLTCVVAVSIVFFYIQNEISTHSGGGTIDETVSSLVNKAFEK